MFGFRFPENFDHPYVARSVQEFWRRWHISLSSWFRDYVYVPLGGNRVSPARMYANLVAVFFLCGLWHGASWSFVVWGLFHGAFLVIERLGLAERLRRLPALAQHAYLLAVVMIGWVFFRAPTLSGAGVFLRALAGFGEAAPTPFTAAWYLTPQFCLAAAAGIIGSAPLATMRRLRWTATTSLVAETAALSLLLFASILQIAAGTYDPFIYFRF